MYDNLPAQRFSVRVLTLFDPQEFLRTRVQFCSSQS